MRLPKSSGKPKKPNVLVRQVAGKSMTPTLRTGQIVIASGRFRRLRIYDIVIIRHQGFEKIKRVAQVDPQKGVFVLGDNLAQSTDSRHFGWVPLEAVAAKVYWPQIP